MYDGGEFLVCSVGAGRDRPGTSTSGMQMGGMQMDMEEKTASQLPSPHAGSGTGWQPVSVPANEWMWMHGGWELMAHGVIFIDYNQQGGPRGEGKAESVNWGMTMEQHRLGGEGFCCGRCFRRNR